MNVQITRFIIPISEHKSIMNIPPMYPQKKKKTQTKVLLKWTQVFAALVNHKCLLL